jgi:NET1-associated nuclear protein 1 (U3 small nucleolar RNA-associated protein 17)
LTDRQKKSSSQEPHKNPHKDYDNTMASQLKRKRDPVEVLGTPKRSKSVKTKSGNPISFNEKIGWEAAFKKPKRGESAPRNGVNGESQNSQDISSSPEAVDFEEFVGEKLEEGLEEGAIQTMAKKTSRAAATEAKRKRKIESFEVQQKGRVKMKPWKLSEPVGGRMINVDPVFTEHEKYAGYLI